MAASGARLGSYYVGGRTPGAVVVFLRVARAFINHVVLYKRVKCCLYGVVANNLTGIAAVGLYCCSIVETACHGTGFVPDGAADAAGVVIGIDERA